MFLFIDKIKVIMNIALIILKITFLLTLNRCLNSNSVIHSQIGPGLTMVQ